MLHSFRGRASNKVDAKGRVSVPVKFRLVFEARGESAVLCYPSLREEALEAGGGELAETMGGLLSQLAFYSGMREVVESELTGRCEELTLDAEGRVMLPASLRTHAGIEDEVLFVGMGERFRMWSPASYERFAMRGASKFEDHIGDIRGKALQVLEGLHVKGGSDA